MTAILRVEIQERVKQTLDGMARDAETVGKSIGTAINRPIDQAEDKLEGLAEAVVVLGKKLADALKLQNSLNSMGRGLDEQLAKLRAVGAEAAEIQDTLNKRAKVDVDASAVRKVSEEIQALIHQAKQAFQETFAAASAEAQSMANRRGMGDRVASGATRATAAGFGESAQDEATTNRIIADNIKKTKEQEKERDRIRKMQLREAKRAGDEQIANDEAFSDNVSMVMNQIAREMEQGHREQEADANRIRKMQLKEAERSGKQQLADERAAQQEAQRIRDMQLRVAREAGRQQIADERRTDADRNTDARLAAQQSAVDARRSSSERQRAAGIEREIANTERQIRQNEALANTDQDVADAVAELRAQLNALNQALQDSLQLAERYETTSQLNRRQAETLAAGGVSVRTGNYIENQFEEQERALRESGNRQTNAANTEQRRTLEQGRRDAETLRREVDQLQQRAEGTVARANKQFAQATNMQVAINDLRSYIQQLEAVEEPTQDQIDQLTEWRTALAQLTQAQRDLMQAAESSARAGRIQTTRARNRVDVLNGRGPAGVGPPQLPPDEMDEVNSRQANLDIGSAGTALKTVRTESRAAATELGLVGRFLHGVSGAAERNRKILIDIAQAYLINTRAGNEAFNALQRAAAQGGTGMLARMAAHPMALPALLGGIVVAGGAYGAYKGNERAMKDQASAGDKGAEESLYRMEGRAVALRGAVSQLLVAMRQGTDHTGLFGTAFRFLAQMAENAKHGLAGVMETLAGTGGRGNLAEYYESIRVGRERAFDVRREQRGKAATVGAGFLNSREDMQAEIARTQYQIAGTGDARLIRDALNPRLEALESRYSDLYAAELTRGQKMIAESAKLLSTETGVRVEIQKLEKLLRTASSGMQADKIIANLAAMRDRLHEIREEMQRAQIASQVSWQNQPNQRFGVRASGAMTTEDIATERTQIAADVAKSEADAGRAEAAWRKARNAQMEFLGKRAERQRNETPTEYYQRRNIELNHPEWSDDLKQEAELKKNKDEAAGRMPRAQANLDRTKKEAEERRLMLEEQERKLGRRREEENVAARQAGLQHDLNLAQLRMRTQRDVNKLQKEEQELNDKIAHSVRGSADELNLLNQRRMTQNRLRELSIELVEAEIEAERTLFDLQYKQAESDRQYQRIRDRNNSSLNGAERAFARSNSVGGFTAAQGPLMRLMGEQQSRMRQLEDQIVSGQTALARASQKGSGATKQDVALMQRQLDEAMQERDQLRNDVQQSQADRINAAQQSAEGVRALSTGENRRRRAGQFDLAERRLGTMSGVDEQKARRGLIRDMQAEMDRLRDSSKQTADELERMERAGQGGSAMATHMRVQLERQAQLAADIAQRMEQQVEAERESLLLARQKESEKRSEASRTALQNMRDAGQMDPLTALGRSISNRDVGRQVLADRRGEMQRLIDGGMDPANARRRAFGNRVSDEERADAKQRIGQAKIDELEKRGLISEQQASQFREQLNAEAETLREQFRLRKATEELTATLKGINKLGPNKPAIEGANPNKAQGLQDDFAEDPRIVAARKDRDEKEAARQAKIKAIADKNRRRRAGDMFDQEDALAEAERKKAEIAAGVAALQEMDKNPQQRPRREESEEVLRRRQLAMERQRRFQEQAQQLREMDNQPIAAGPGKGKGPAPGEATQQATNEALSAVMGQVAQLTERDVQNAKTIEAATQQFLAIVKALTGQGDAARNKAQRAVNGGGG